MAGAIACVAFRTARCTLLLVDGHFVSLSEYGTLTLLKVNSTKYDEVSRFDPDEVARFLTDTSEAGLAIG